MALTAEQTKGRIRNIAKKTSADAIILLRIYMMERFLERIANSPYADNFIIKGGILVTSMVGVSMRSTMDIDTTIKNLNLSAEDALRIVNEICSIDLEDAITFETENVSPIMDEMEYPGIRIVLTASLEKMKVPLKIDISTGDIITPTAIQYQYSLMLEDRSISLWSYNLETILAEKLQTVLARGILNTRMRDFYDICVLLCVYNKDIDVPVLNNAFLATCKKRSTEILISEGEKIILEISEDESLKKSWKSYQKKFTYALDYSYEAVIDSVKCLFHMACSLRLQA